MKKNLTLLILIIALCQLDSFAGANEDLFDACKKGDLEAVKKAVGDGAKVNALDANGNPAITSAFFWPDIVQYLLDNKADPNLGNRTVLFQAAFYCSSDVVKIVLANGANANWVGTSSAADGFLKLIADEKAKGKQANKGNIKVWEMAAQMIPSDLYTLPFVVNTTNCVACLQELLDKGANPQNGLIDGNLLHAIAGSGATKEYRQTVYDGNKTGLESLGVKVPDWYSNMPEDKNGTTEQMVKVLVSKGININEKNKGAHGIPPLTPLEITLGGGLGNKEEVALVLVNNGADVKAEHAWYGPAILQAAQCGFATVLNAMIEKGADINTEGKCFTDAGNSATIKNFTPLTCAAAKNRLEAVKLLLEKGAKTEGISGLYSGHACAPELSNKSAIYFAIENKNLDMVKVIAEHNGFNGKNISVTARTMSNCLGSGSYTPSEYADFYNASAISAYLKTQGM